MSENIDQRAAMKSAAAQYKQMAANTDKPALKKLYLALAARRRKKDAAARRQQLRAQANQAQNDAQDAPDYYWQDYES